MIRVLLPASVALHVVVIGLLPSEAPVAIAERPSTVIEVANVPPPPPPPPEPAPAATHETPARTTPRAARAPIAHATPGLETSADAPALPAVPAAPIDAPADFTGTVLSNAAAAIGGPSPRATSVRAAPPAPPRFVPAASLARPPRAPGLDGELERNYPLDARRAGIAGKAVLRVRILADGRVASVEHVSETYAGFADACARTVRAARWEPPIDADGRPAATEITYVCRFEVRS